MIEEKLSYEELERLPIGAWMRNPSMAKAADHAAVDPIGHSAAAARLGTSADGGFSTNRLRRSAALFACGILGMPIASFAQLHRPLALNSTLGFDPALQAPGWPASVTAPKGAPNVVLILIDDIGFSATSTFGGAIQTPCFDRLAASGLRYNEFQVNAICSPTRASLLSGRNDHEVGFGTVAEAASPFPGYNALWPKKDASIAEVLKDNGYSTAAFGKWHNTPMWETSPVGPFDRWPTGLGFQHFYGFLSGNDNQYFPRLYRDTVPVEPSTTPEEGYSFTQDITNEAIRWLREEYAVYPERPFFLYFAPGATHTPHQVPKKWIAKYKGKFDMGWDVLRQETFARQKKLGIIPKDAELTPRPPGLPSWASLSPQQKKLFAHQAEVYAGFTEQTDYEISRLLQEIAAEGKSENTLVIEIFGDNGASAEGGLEGTDALTVDRTSKTIDQRLKTESALGSELFMNHYAAAWAWAQSSPFQGTKEDASHLGGTRDPMVISWPARIYKGGGIRSQFQHVTDIAPTVYEAAGIKMPEIVNGVKQTPLEGSSLLYTFDHPDEPSHHHVQYFETLGNRGIYKDGWWAGDLRCNPWNRGCPWDTPNVNQHPWELYDLKDDYSQTHNLAAKYPEKLKQMEELFDAEAKRNQVYPLLPPVRLDQQPSPAYGRKLFIYREGVDRIPNQVAPQIVGNPHTIIADLEIPPSGARGVIVAQGGRYGGFTLFVKNWHVIYEVNAFGNRSGELVSKDALTPGKTHIVLRVMPDRETPIDVQGYRVPAPGKARLEINGRDEGEAAFVNINGSSFTETLDVGSDLGSAVDYEEYTTPYRFTGTIDQIRIELK